MSDLKTADEKVFPGAEESQTDDINEGIHISTAEEKRLVRQIDLHLLPLMIGLYILQYLDKTSLSSAAIMGIQQDTHLVGQDYSWISSLFYFGYLFASPVTAVVFVKLPIAKAISISAGIWAVILACHGAANNFAGLSVLRTFLGIFEAAISPGFSIITATWYKPEEHASRHGLWFAGNAVAGIFGGILGYAILHIKGSIMAWRWLFIIYGIVTLIWAVVLLIFLPDTPMKARWLTPKQRIAASVRTQHTNHTHNDSKFKWYQAIEALKDPKTWLFFSYIFLTSVPNGGLTNFGNIIVEGFGYTTLHTILLSMPSAAFQLLYVIIGTQLAARIPNSRCIIIAVLNGISLAGILMVKLIPTNHSFPRLVGLVICAGFAGGFPLSLSLIASNTTGYTKKTVTSGIFFLGYCAGNISAYICMIACFTLAIVVIIFLRQIMHFVNKKRDRVNGQISVPENDTVGQVVDLVLDETDWENQAMRYQL